MNMDLQVDVALVREREDDDDVPRGLDNAIADFTGNGEGAGVPAVPLDPAPTKGTETWRGAEGLA